MEYLPTPNSKPFILLSLLLTFFLLPSVIAQTDLVLTDEDIKIKEKELFDTYKIKEIEKLTKEKILNDTKIKNTKGEIIFFDKDVSDTEVLITEGLVSVINQPDTKAYVKIKTNEINKTLAIYKYQGIADKKKTREEGELYTLVQTDENGYAGFRAFGFSTFTTALPDPVTTGVDSSRLVTYDIDNFVDTYTFLQVLFTDPETSDAVNLLVSYDPDITLWTDDAYIGSNYAIYLSENDDSSGFEIMFQTRTINTAYAQNVTDIIIKAGEDNGTAIVFDTQTIDWQIGDAVIPDAPAGSPSIDTTFSNTYYLDATDSGDFIYFADMEVYFSNFTSIELYFNDPYYYESVYLVANVSENNFGLYQNTDISFLMQDFSSTIDLQISNRNTDPNKDGQEYEVTARAVNTNGYVDQIFTVTFNTTPEPSPSYDLTSGLTAYYTFDNADLTGGEPDDVTGNGNDGTLTSITTGVTGKLGEAIDLDNAADVMDVTATTLAGSYTSLSINMWVKWDALPAPGSVDTLVEIYDNGGADRAGIIGYVGNDDMSYVQWLPSSGTDANVGGELNVTAGTWYMFTYVMDGSNAKLYLNGNQVLNPVATGTNVFSSPEVVIGNQAVAHTRGHNGQIDEVGIWKNEALNVSEIETLYNGGAGLSYVDFVGGSSSVEGDVVQTASFGNIELYGVNSTELFFSGYFANYTNVSVTFTDDIQSQTGAIFSSINGVSDEYDYPHINMLLTPYTNDVRLRINSNDTLFNTTIFINASNSNSSATANFTLNTYNFTESVNAPNITATIPDYNILVGTNQSLTIGSYFDNYDNATISGFDPSLLSTFNITNTEDHNSSILNIYGGVFGWTFVGVEDYLDTLGEDSTTFTYLVSVYNANSSVSQNITFTVYRTATTPSAFGNIVDFFIGLFPDSDGLSTSQGLGYAIIAMLLSIGAIYLAINSAGGSMGVAGILSVIVVFMEVFFFVSIGYISILVVVLLGLFTALIGYAMLSRSGIGGV